MFSGRGQTEVVALPGGGRPAGSATVSPAPGAGPSTSSGSDSSAGSAGSAGSAASSGPAGPASSSGPAAAPGSTTAPAQAVSAPILLHVLGAVAHPGLYELHVGDRVVDAVAAAGGFAANADQGQQNLARVVVDGEQLVIPEQGVAPPLGSAAAGGGAGVGWGQGAGGAAGSGGASGAGGAGGGAVPLVNVNTADQAALETLPQVGPALAQRIIAWRTANGRFTQLDDLKNVTGIGDKTFEALKPLVTI
ncbi:hypothetical protein B7R25_05915 [Subtercola boreus]|uniref:Soluble ligand binding domain-containing protein n=2 Tax=Subtercola boreus TaxID=120213 RepID=A0A3E0WBU4_9MICO|nr:hypothetical protein B7R24_05845 [Subtercola boreus]RFA21981.1 hypothetical protein B7R23_05790 [Subtercola boreus]RFA27927.1 hypothetical protein B7R25_05915 [Subtercola boreus]